MLLRSSKRAFSSTSTATCLPWSAASISRSTSGELAPMRYSVILIAMTCGSCTAARRNVSTEVNESNGWWSRKSWSAICSNTLSVSSGAHSVRGTSAGYFSAGRCSLNSACQSPKPSRSVARATTSSSTSKFSIRMLNTRLGMSASTCSSDSAPWRNCFRPRSTVSSRSSASSSWITMSVSRMIRNRCVPSTCVPGNSVWMLRRMTSSRNTCDMPAAAATGVRAGR